MKITQEKEATAPDLYKGMRDKESWARDFWQDHHIFKKSLKQREGAEPFVFFDGPPTANGLPHLGHFLTRIYKDLYGRYKTMRGYYVLRRAGWDTHGLPVEIEVEKELGLKNKKEIEDYGVAKFNARAKESVWKYKGVWEAMTRKIGFWIEMQDPYITYDQAYIESVWHIIQEISDRKLLYQGHKVLPYCTRCGTSLSSHEVAQGYKEDTDTSVFVRFKLKEGQSIRNFITTDYSYILAWTTTPWTLPGNVALAINTETVYSIVMTPGADSIYIIAADKMDLIPGYELLIGVKGRDLINLEYEPLFDVEHLKSKHSYKVYPAEFVTTADGTGVVHTAVMYGEDDYQLGKNFSLPMHHTVDEQGKFTKDVPMLEGAYAKSEKTEEKIIEYLRDRGLIFKTEKYTHSYPHCWRCKTALIYYAKNSWFISMSSLRSQLIVNNQTVNWLPAHIRDGRFGEFLKEAKDWALSRERYWGTPLPVWKCQKCSALKVIGSYDELEKYRYDKKNTYYLVRHGASTKNGGASDDTDIVASRLENDMYDLTDEGVKQIEDIATALTSKGGADVIVSSPFKRTQHTAQIIADKLGLKVQTDVRLKELDHGSELEGKSHSLCVPCHSDYTLNTRLYDGETRNEVKARMVNLIQELETEYAGKKIVIVSHGDPFWLLQSGLNGFNEKQTFEYKKEIYLKKGELKEIDVKNLPYNQHGDLDPHKPFIDEIRLRCSECRCLMKRVPELIDVWFDSGAMPYAQWHYPFEHKNFIDDSASHERQFPADFIIEGIDQTRGWFYTMMAISTALGRPAPYKNVAALGFVTNDKGKKLSKSEGAGEGFDKILNEKSIDVLRWYFYSVSDLGEDKRFSLESLDSKYRSFHMILLNLVRFLELYPTKDTSIFDASALSTVLDKWIFRQLQVLIQGVTDDLDQYRATSAARRIETFIVTDLSQWWLRLSRPRFQRPRSEQDFALASSLFRYILKDLSLVMAPFMPFLSETLYRDLVKPAGLESVHLADWPKVQAMTSDLDKEMSLVRELVTKGLAQRKLQQMKVRQPLATATLKSADTLHEELEAILIAELNVKKIAYDTKQEEDIVLDIKLSEELILEGYARDIMRQIQDMRKEAGYSFEEKVAAVWHSESPRVISALEIFSKQIQDDTLLNSLTQKSAEALGGADDVGVAYDVEAEFEVRPGIKLWLGLKK